MPDLSTTPVPIREAPAGLTACMVTFSAVCGFPSPSADWEEDQLDLVDLLRLDAPGAFVFRLSGASMIEAGLHDGDVVVVDKGATPRNGCLVIAVVEGAFVCRQFVVRRGVPMLEARNSRMSYPVCVCDETVEIWGVVRAAVRDLQQ